MGKVKRYLIVLSILLPSLLLVAAVIGLVLFIITNNTRLKDEKEVHSYQYLQYTPSRDETSSGIVKVFDEIPPNEFFFYETDDTDDGMIYSLLSHFGSREYFCSGTCYCDDFRRTSASGVFTKGILYLVAAASSILAYNQAQEYFQEECVRKLEESCLSTSSIKSDVDFCQSVADDDSTTTSKSDETTTESTSQESSSFQKSRIVTYKCEGNCLLNLKYSRFFLHYGMPKMVYNMLMLDKACEKIKLTEEIKAIVDPKDYKETSLNWEIDDELLTNNKARLQFEREVLEPFCENNSGTKDGFEIPPKSDILPSAKKKDPDYVELMFRKASHDICTGLTFPESSLLHPPDHIQCRKVIRGTNLGGEKKESKKKKSKKVKKKTYI